MHPEKKNGLAWGQLALGVIGTVAATAAAAMLAKFADIPTRLSVVETRTTGLDQRLTSMDGKLDAILARTER